MRSEIGAAFATWPPAAATWAAVICGEGKNTNANSRGRSIIFSIRDSHNRVQRVFFAVSLERSISAHTAFSGIDLALEIYI